MPYNMKKAGMKYQDGGSIKKTAKKAVNKAKSVDDAIEKKYPSVAKNPAYKGAKSAAKSTLKYLGLMQKGGAMKSPDASKYVGNPMGYYADKAAYGREMARQKMMQGGGPYDSNIEALNVLEQEGDAMRARKQKRLDSKLKRKQTKEKISSVNADIARNRSDKRAANQSNRMFGRR